MLSALQEQRTQLTHSQLSLQSFKESEDEVTERKEMQSKLFFYIIQKYTAQHLPENSHGAGIILNDVRQFLDQGIAYEQKPSLIIIWNWLMKTLIVMKQ